MNTLKTTFLLTLLTVLLLAIGGLVGGTKGLTIMVVVSLVTNFSGYWFSDRIVFSMYGAKEISPQEFPEVIKLVASLAQKAKLPIPKVYLIEADAPNAFATGRNPSNAVVVITMGLINVLTSDELEAVLAHELAHIKRRDTLISTIVATIAGVITVTAHIIQGIVVVGMGGNTEKSSSISQVAESIIMMALAPLAAAFIQFGISRTREFQADATGSSISGKPLALAGALLKIEEFAKEQVMMEASPATSHMFIVNPYSSSNNWVLNLFSTHPLTSERIQCLKEFAKQLK